MTIEVKICGISTEAALDAAVDAGADHIGLVSFPKSPRHVSPERARVLADRARGRVSVALLTVDADEATLAALIEATAPDVLQLHGRETPERIGALRTRFGRPVWKSAPVATAEDLVAAKAYWRAADRVLLDAKPPQGALLPGGNGVAFDWRLLANLDPPRSFVLSGGLSPETVAEAIRLARPHAVDVSSGVESAPGVKDPERIRAFVREARAASAS
jgi:phosphoribosylanthranilate isomerase